MPSDPSALERTVRELARQAGLELQPHHLPGVLESYARLEQQGELLMAFPLDDADEPAPVYVP
jgi:hypothetical protein